MDQAIAVALLAGFLPLSALADLVSIGALCAFMLVAIAVPILRKRRRPGAAVPGAVLAGAADLHRGGLPLPDPEPVGGDLDAVPRLDADRRGSSTSGTATAATGWRPAKPRTAPRSPLRPDRPVGCRPRRFRRPVPGRPDLGLPHPAGPHPAPTHPAGVTLARRTWPTRPRAHPRPDRVGAPGAGLADQGCGAKRSTSRRPPAGVRSSDRRRWWWAVPGASPGRARPRC